MSVISTGTKGAIGELSVCADLLSKGYAVFRAVSPHCPCDLVVIKGTQTLRIEVRRGIRSKGKNYLVPKKDDMGKQDAFAWITPEGIVYSPDFTK